MSFINPPIGLTLDQQFRAEHLAPGLRGQMLRPAQGAYDSFTHILLIRDGAALIETGPSQTGQDQTGPDQTGQDRHDLTGPCAVILPPDRAAVIRIPPGTAGGLLGMSPAIIGNILGTSAEAGFLASITTRLTIVQGVDRVAGADQTVFGDNILAEIAGDAPGAYVAIQSSLRLLLIEIWRRGSFQQSSSGEGNEMHILLGYRRLVELHFRTHMKVAEYARHLGVSYDRLHRICQRNLGRAPLELINQRMMREAVMWLERSGHSVEEIAYSLGFSDSSHFSHFFKRNNGNSPSAYRADARNHKESTIAPSRSFSDWP